MIKENRSSTLIAFLSLFSLQAESHSPGISLELVSGILKKADMNVNMTESLLRLQGNMPEIEGNLCNDAKTLAKCLLLVIFSFFFLSTFSRIDYAVRRHEEPFQELNKKSVALRRILSRIPDEINDRRTFLETIK